MKKHLLFFLLLFFAVPVVAAAAMPPAYDVALVKDHFGVRMPSDYWQMYTVKDNHPYNLKEVSSPGFSSKFEPPLYSTRINNPTPGDVAALVENLSVKSKWIRLRLTNTSAEVKKVFISCKGGADTYYVFQSGKWHTFKNGFLLAWNRREGDVNNNRVPVAVAPGEEVVVYVNSYISSSIPNLDNYDTAIKGEYLERLLLEPEAVVNFGFAAFIAFALVFNLLFYYVNREKLYLNYAIMLFFIAAICGWETVINIWFPGVVRYSPEIYAFLGGGLLISLINTFQLFLNFKFFTVFWSNFLKYFSWVAAILTFLTVVFVMDVRPYFDETTPFIAAVVLVFIFLSLFGTLGVGAFIIVLIRTLIKLKKKKDPEAQIIFWAIVPYLATFLPYVPDYQLLTAMWGVTYLSWGMFARFKRLQEQYAVQAIEKERITREKEEEKNALIAQQNTRLEQLVEERTAELELSLNDLKQTQAQLIQSEKMASLGELTAGIAHEIQNPLNFVNNFSDVSAELLDEMEEELDKGDMEEAKAIAGDIKQNLEKIAHHGRRADSIVKGMLQHSRTSSGQKEPTDINGLADEYLRLAYHGLRAKDKSFNAELITHFDANLPKVNVLPQDMGRVLLNLFTNAFYATQQKAKQYSVISGQSTVEAYKPAVTVTTKLVDNAVEITVQDNGTGIPDEIKDKILQPFFTTKPTGEGTGLGLSLSYDIVVKAHGGTIEINSEEGVYTAFVITVPV